jgi:UDP-N-acetylglucosamine 2-epimerase (non-hydrolysing)
MRVVVGFGTRPEAIKLAPVILRLFENPTVDTKILVTGQHREQLDSVLKTFGIAPDHDLDIMTNRQPLEAVASKILKTVPKLLGKWSSDYLVIQGDTVSTYTLAFSALLAQVKIAHIEAGLRTGSMAEPFPEEAMRRLTSVVSAIDFCPTPGAKQNLLNEGKPDANILVTGQTSVDAALSMASYLEATHEPTDKQQVLITLHRRENWPILRKIAEVIRDLATAHVEYDFTFPVHLNPVVRDAVVGTLTGLSNVRLCEPVDYTRMISLLRASSLVITDSGGLQEEGVTLGTPVAVIRNMTERPEGVAVGGIVLTGTEPDQVRQILSELLTDPVRLNRMRNRPNPYGDGKASSRIVEGLLWHSGFGSRPADWTPPV